MEVNATRVGEHVGCTAQEQDDTQRKPDISEKERRKRGTDVEGEMHKQSERPTVLLSLRRQSRRRREL